MNLSQPPSPDDLIARIRSEVARRRRGSALTNSDLALPESMSIPALPASHLPGPSFTPAARYSLGDFLAVHDREFVDAAYRGLLKRRADPQGETHFLGALRKGDLSKIEILGRLRYSPEGRKLKVPVKGLLPAFTIQHSYRIPVIGACIAWASALLRLPLIVRNLGRVESYQHLHNSQMEEAVSALARAASANEQLLLHRIEFARGSIAESSRRIGAAVDSLQQRHEELDGHWRRIADAVDETQREIVSSTERITREAEQHRAEVSGIRESLAGEIARNAAEIERALHNGTQFAAALEQGSRKLLENETKLTDLESASRNHDMRLVALQTLEKQFGAALEEANEKIERRRLAAEAAEKRMAGLESVSMHWEQRLLDALTQVQEAARGNSSLRQAVAALEERMGNAQTSSRRLAERLARAEGRLHEQSMSLAAPGGASVPERVARRKVAPAAGATSASPRFDALYFAFEQRFRGTREEIRRRLRYYLPLLKDSAVGREGSPVLDVGCGRGEWLELLRDENITARGIDINPAMVQECREHDLDVVAADAIAQLKRLPDNALGALTGFHIVEHISLETLLELIEQARRVVEPGGLVIFETPNPENIFVGACNFYIDPTHQRPLPPVMTQFLFESGGFSDVEIHRVNANLLPKLFEAAAADDPPALRSAVQFLHSAFLSAPDYSVVGRVA